MTKSQKLIVEQSEKRERINALLEKADDLTADERTELGTLTARMQALEPELRAAITVEAAEAAEAAREHGVVGDPEIRERFALRGRARLSNYFLAAARGRMVDGAESELAQAAGVTGIPLELFDVPERREREDRAITPAPGTVGINLDPIRPAVFAGSIASRLGIDMPRVGSGTYASATITGSQTAAAKRKSPHADAAADATAGALTVTTATPKRVSARLELAIEDIAAVGQENFEAILRQNLGIVLSDELDDQMINGTGAAPNLTGMFQRLTTPAAPVAGVAGFDAFVSLFAGSIDGLWANTASEIGIVVNPETYRLALQTFRDRIIDTGNRGGVSLGAISFADYAREHFGGFGTNKRMPDKAAHVSQCILYRGGRSAMGASMGMRTAVCPHWGEVSIDDIYSGAASGVRSFTMHVLLGDVILVQPDAYAEVSIRVSV